MRIAIGSDHRGFHLKEQLVSLLNSQGHQVFDEGTSATEAVDYPDFAALVARKISDKEVDRGILICGTGIGMAIAANKFHGVRAAPCTAASSIGRGALGLDAAVPPRART